MGYYKCNREIQLNVFITYLFNLSIIIQISKPCTKILCISICATRTGVIYLIFTLNKKKSIITILNQTQKDGCNKYINSYTLFFLVLVLLVSSCYCCTCYCSFKLQRQFSVCFFGGGGWGFWLFSSSFFCYHYVIGLIFIFVFFRE